MYLCKMRPTPKRVSRVPRLLKNTGAEGLDGWACCSINFWRRLAEGCSFPRSPVNNVELKSPAKAAGAAEGRSTQHYWALNIILPRSRMRFLTGAGDVFFVDKRPNG